MGPNRQKLSAWFIFSYYETEMSCAAFDSTVKFAQHCSTSTIARFKANSKHIAANLFLVEQRGNLRIYALIELAHH